MKKNRTIFVALFSAFLFLFSTGVAEAKVMWGKTELKQGQIGKVTIVTNVNAVKLNGNTLVQDKRLKKAEEYRVYSYRVIGNSGYYGLGGGLFVQKSSRIKYETPSKAKLRQLEQEKHTAISNSRVATTLKDSQGVAYNLYVVGSNEKKSYASYDPSNDWSFVWAGANEGDVLFKGNYKIYLQKAGSSTITDTGIKINNYTYNATRGMMYKIGSPYKGQPDLFAIAETQSSNFEAANLYYINNGQLFRVKHPDKDWPYAITYTVRPKTVDKNTFLTQGYNNSDGTWYENIWSP